MLKSESSYPNIEGIVLKNFKNNLVDLIIETASITGSQNQKDLDPTLVSVFLDEIKKADQAKTDSLSDYYLLNELIGDMKLSGTPLVTIEKDQITSVDKSELLKVLQELHSKIKEVSIQLKTPSNGLFLVS